MSTPSFSAPPSLLPELKHQYNHVSTRFNFHKYPVQRVSCEVSPFSSPSNLVEATYNPLEKEIYLHLSSALALPTCFFEMVGYHVCQSLASSLFIHLLKSSTTWLQMQEFFSPSPPFFTEEYLHVKEELLDETRLFACYFAGYMLLRLGKNPNPDDNFWQFSEEEIVEFQEPFEQLLLSSYN